MNGGVVRIGCKLPHGMVLELGVPGEKDYQVVELNGLSKASRGAKYGITAVPTALWQAWLAKNNMLRYVVDRSIFISPSR